MLQLNLTSFAEIAQIIEAIVASILLIYALVFARDLREAIRARHLDGMKFVRDLIGTEQAADNRRWVYQELEKTVRPLSSEDADRVRAICRDFDNIGLLCRHGLLPVSIVAETYNRNILDMWNRLEPIIVEWRQTLGDADYYAEFEWLADQASKAEGRLAKRRRRKQMAI
jgi:hypothetical protein